MSRRLEWALAALIFLTAAGLRLSDLGLLELKGDEAVAIDLALPMVEGQALPRVGLVNSVGLRNPPLFVWATALPAWISVDPRVVTGALIGFPAAVAVLLTWLLLRRRFGAGVALCAAAFYAVAPWPVLYGRKLWGQDVLPIFSALLLWLFFVLLERKKTRWVAALPVLLMVLWQLHLSAIGFMALFLGVVVWRWRQVHWPAFAAGCVAALLLLWPYIQEQLDHDYRDLHGFENMARGLRADGKPRERPKTWSWDSVRWAGYISAGNNLKYACGPSWGDFLGWRSGIGEATRRAGQAIAFALLGLGTLLLGIGPVMRWWRRRAAALGDDAGPDNTAPQETGPEEPTETRERRASLALALFWVGYLLIFSALRLERVFPHYYIILFPAPFVAMALGLRAVWQKGMVGRGLAGGLMVVVMLGNLGTLRAFQTYLHARGGTAGDYGVTFEHKEELARWIVGTGVTVVGYHEYAVAHQERMERRYGDMDAVNAVVARRGMPLKGMTRVRIWNTLRAPRVTGRQCTDRRDFGPLMVCATP